MDARLGRIDAVIADVIAEEHVLEIKYYCAGHEPALGLLLWVLVPAIAVLRAG